MIGREIVRESTLAEHRKLVEMIFRFTSAFDDLGKDIQRGDTEYYEDSKFLDHLSWQATSLGDLVDDVLNGRYRESYNNIRMIFEFYLLLDLMSTGTKYTIRYLIHRQKDDASISMHAAKAQFIESVKQAMKTSRPDILGIHRQTNNSVTLVHRGVRVVDADGSPTGELVPWFRAAWENYHPDHHQHIAKLSTGRFLTQRWKPFRNRRGRQDDTEQREIYRNVFSFDGLITNLRLNGRLNKKTATRVYVHYNFLSGYTHTTHQGIMSLRQSNWHRRVYDHFHSELCLLYVAHLLQMHLELALRYFRWRRIPISNERKKYRALSHDLEIQFGYFWFIFNDPHEWDRYDTANRMSDLQNGIVIRPQEVSNAAVRYAESPLSRLRSLHSSAFEFTTGNQFDSPFPRSDAR